MKTKVEHMSSSLSESQQTKHQLETELSHLQESSRSEIAELYDRLGDKTKAGKFVIYLLCELDPALNDKVLTNGLVYHLVEQLSMALEDEREEVKAVRKKNANNIRDLQRQLQQSKRYTTILDI